MLGTYKYYILIFLMALVTVWDEQEANYVAAAVIQERDASVLDESGRWRWTEKYYPGFRS